VVAVIVSVPDLVAVTVNDACPVDAVVTVAGLNVLPSADTRVTAVLEIPVFAEFARETVYVPVPFKTRVGEPVTVNVVPVTGTAVVAVAPSAVAVTVMVLLVGSPPGVKVANAFPVESVVA
jgi:hypothetical protein